MVTFRACFRLQIDTWDQGRTDIWDEGGLSHQTVAAPFWDINTVRENRIAGQQLCWLTPLYMCCTNFSGAALDLFDPNPLPTLTGYLKPNAFSGFAHHTLKSRQVRGIINTDLPFGPSPLGRFRRGWTQSTVKVLSQLYLWSVSVQIWITSTSMTWQAFSTFLMCKRETLVF